MRPRSQSWLLVVVFCSSALAGEISWPLLQRLAEEAAGAPTAVKAADGFTDLLAKEDPAALKSCVFYPVSGAIDRAKMSFEFPRLVCYFPGKGGHSFVVGMSGDPSEESTYAQFEIQEFNPAGSPHGPVPSSAESRDMLTHRIHFYGEGRKHVEVDGFADMWHESSARGDCASCHAPREGYYPTPIVRAKFYSGAFGQLGDRVVAGNQEFTKWSEFRKNATGSDPRFRRYRYADLAHNRLFEERRETVRTGDRTREAIAFPNHPNGQFLDFLNRITEARIANVMRHVPEFERYRYAIAGALLDCDRYEGFFPQEVFERHRHRLLREDEALRKQLEGKPDLFGALAEASRRSSERMMTFTVFSSPHFAGYFLPDGRELSKVSREERARLLFDTASPHWRFSIVAKLRLLFDGMGLDPEANTVRRWSPIRERAGSGYLFGDGEASGRSIADVLPALEKDLGPEIGAHTREKKASACEWLRAKSYADLGHSRGARSLSPRSSH